MSTAASSAPPRLVDATLVACWHHDAAPLERDAVHALTQVLPLQTPHTCGAVPIVAADAYGHERLQHAATRAVFLHPIDPAALESIARLPESPHTRFVVDPRPLDHAANGSTHGLPPSMTWERRHVLDAPPTANAITGAIDNLLARLPLDERLRIEDPHGQLDLQTAKTLARHPHAARLTLAASDTRGIATAIGHLLLSVHDGPRVVSTLLGRAPHGAPATEHLVPAHTRDTLRHAAETVALATGRAIPPEHPWGTGADTKRIQPGHLDALVQRHLDDWDIHLDADTHARLMATLRARLRPGDRLDGPILWATLSTITDLTTHATTRTGKERT